MQVSSCLCVCVLQSCKYLVVFLFVCLSARLFVSFNRVYAYFFTLLSECLSVRLPDCLSIYSFNHSFLHSLNQWLCHHLFIAPLIQLLYSFLNLYNLLLVSVQSVIEFIHLILHCFFQQDLNTRLKNIINSADCMLFMKGKPEEPKCGKKIWKISDLYIQWQKIFRG